KYPKKKQWALEHVRFSNEWVLYIDADELVTPALVQEIGDAVDNPSVNGFFIGLDYVFMGRRLKHGPRVYKLALFRRGCGRFVDYDDLDATNMWEVEGHYQPVVEGARRRSPGGSSIAITTTCTTTSTGTTSTPTGRPCCAPRARAATTP